MIYKIDQEVLTPKGRGTIIDVKGNEYLINLHAKPGLGPFRYTFKQLTPAPVKEP